MHLLTQTRHVCLLRWPQPLLGFSAGCTARVSSSVRSLCSCSFADFHRCRASGASRFQLIRFAPYPLPQPIGDLQPRQRTEQQARHEPEQSRRGVAQRFVVTALSVVLVVRANN